MPLVTTNADGVPTEPMPTSHGHVTTITPAGTVVANAAAVTTRFVKVTGDDTAGIVLPAANPGDEYLVYNLHATQAVKVYAPVNGTINGGSANAAVAQEGKTLGRYVNIGGLDWAAQFTANS
jgi:hypothetical protein